MASLAGRVARLQREMDGTAEEDACTRWERQQRQKSLRQVEEASRQWFYAGEVVLLQDWPGGLENAEGMVIRRLARAARTTGIYPNQWRCLHHLRDGIATDEGMGHTLRLAMAVLEVRGELWPAGREHVTVEPDERTDEDMLYAFQRLVDWLPTITEHPAWAYDGMTPERIRLMHPLDDEHRRRLIAEAQEAAAYPTGRPLPPCPDCQAQGE